MSNSTKKNYYANKFYDHKSFGSTKEDTFLNPMRYHGAFIKNTYYH